jgi:dynactin complex subunit
VNTQKLKEALVELQQERDKLESMIVQLRSMIASVEPARGNGANLSETARVEPKSSYIDDAVKILERHGKPMHVKKITDQISEMRHSKVARGSVESSIARHVSLGERSRLAKFGPSRYGLSNWRRILTSGSEEENADSSDASPSRY